MHIRIEIDGRTVLDTNVPTPAQPGREGLYTAGEQAPEELLREARARGGQSAGRAAYVQAAGVAAASGDPLATRPATTVAGPRSKVDGDAGSAVAVQGAARTRARGVPKV